MKQFLGAIILFSITFFFANQALAASDITNLPVNLGVSGITNILYIIAFIGGALMILTPCSVATIPAYFANAFGEKSNGSKSKITQRTIIFFLGFAVVYSFIGGGASFIGRWLNIYQEQLVIISGILLIVFAVLIFLGKSFFSFSLTSKVKTNTDAKGTFLFGTLFAVGFSGCAGPILAGILTVAATLPTTQAVLLMFFYSLGMGIPLVLLSLVFDKYNVTNTKFFKWHKIIKIFGKKVYLTLPNVISAILLLGVGIVFIKFGSTSSLSVAFPKAVSDLAYSWQDWLLRLRLPLYIDIIIGIIVAFILIKVLAKVFSKNKINELISDINVSKIKFTLITIIVIIFTFNQLLFFTKYSEINKKMTIATEVARPAELDFTIITTDSDCQTCFDASKLIEILQSKNMKVSGKKTVDWKSEEGQKLIKELDIKQVPNVVVTGELEKDKEVKALLSQIGEIKDDKFFISEVLPPYIDVQSGEVKGEFEVTYLTDKSCSTCYDVTVNKQAIEGLGMIVLKENTVDISSSEGRKLLNKYAIKAVPTILLTGDLGVYKKLEAVWPTVGSIEKDGTYVFRQVKIMGTYKDLKTGKIIEPPKQSSDTNTSPPPASAPASKN